MKWNIIYHIVGQCLVVYSLKFSLKNTLKYSGYTEEAVAAFAWSTAWN